MDPFLIGDKSHLSRRKARNPPWHSIREMSLLVEEVEAKAICCWGWDRKLTLTKDLALIKGKVQLSWEVGWE